jgi:hypothetical protein
MCSINKLMVFIKINLDFSLIPAIGFKIDLSNSLLILFCFLCCTICSCFTGTLALTITHKTEIKCAPGFVVLIIRCVLSTKHAIQLYCSVQAE